MLLLSVAFVAACADESLDPVKFNEVKKATILALRADAFNALNASADGCAAAFFKNNIIGTEVYSIDTDFLAEDQESLQEVQLYGQLRPASSTAGPRVLIATIPGSAFALPAGSKVKRGIVSAPLSTIMSKLGLTTATAADLKIKDIAMSMDLVLTDGSKVLASALNNPNLFQSVIFYPAMALPYCALDQEDFKPIATPSLLGAWGKTTDGKKVSRTKIPSLKSGAKDTLYFTFDNDIITPPTVSFSPSLAATGSTASALVRSKEVDDNGFYTNDDSKNGFYLVYTAGSIYTGVVTATISGATAEVSGVILTQKTKTQSINVDNTAPIRISTSTGKQIGEGQFVTMKVTFNEKLNTASSKAIKVTVDGSSRGLETVTDAKMTVASDGLSASLIYIFKRAVPTTPATHGDLTVVFTDAIDEAGNTTAIPNATLTVDVGVPPAPTLALAGGDLGTQISWTAAQSTGGSNPGGSISGNVYFIAVTTGKPGPTGFSVDLDGVATWTMQDDPASTTTPKAKVSIQQSGNVGVADGASANPAFTPFAANGTLDIYAVFVSSSGTKSLPTVTPQLAGVVMK